MSAFIFSSMKFAWKLVTTNLNLKKSELSTISFSCDLGLTSQLQSQNLSARFREVLGGVISVALGPVPHLATPPP